MLLGAALVIAAVIIFLPRLLHLAGYILWLFSPFLAAYAVSLLVNPMADGLQKRFHLPRGVSAVLVIVLTVGVLGGILTGVVWKIVDEIRGIYDDFPVIYENIRTAWYDISAGLSNITENLPVNLQNVLNDFSSQTLDWIAGFAKDTSIVQSAGNIARKLPSIFISIIVFLISLYFMVTDNERVTKVVKKPFTPTFLKRLSSLKTEFKRYVGGYVKAQLTIMCISFAILIIGLSVLGVKYALIIAIVIAIVDALPFFGSGAVLWPWAAASFVTGRASQGVGLLIIYLCVIFMRQVVEPKIVGQNIGMHPLLTLAAMYVGYRTLSIGGMILGPFIVMMAISFYRVGFFDEIINFSKGIIIKTKSEADKIMASFKDDGE